MTKQLAADTAHLDLVLLISKGGKTSCRSNTAYVERSPRAEKRNRGRKSLAYILRNKYLFSSSMTDSRT